MDFAPDLLVGDFDSLKQIPEDVPRKAYRPKKNETDLALALWKRAWRADTARSRFYGASGGREDHTHANLQLLGGASKKGCACKMICPDYDVYAITNGTLRAAQACRRGTIVSVFCHGDRAEGVTLRGLKYPLTDAVLTCDQPLGVSNETIRGEALAVIRRKRNLLVYVMLQLRCNDDRPARRKETSMKRNHPPAWVVSAESIVDGRGYRTAVFTQGCPHHCEGCHNPESHEPGRRNRLDA